MTGVVVKGLGTRRVSRLGIRGVGHLARPLGIIVLEGF